MPSLLTKAILASLTGISLGLGAVSPIHAAALGGFQLAGEIVLDPEVDPNPLDPPPSPVTATFNNATLGANTGDFVGATLVSISPTVFIYEFTDLGMDYYTMDSLNPLVITMTGVNNNPDPFILTVTPQPGEFMRVGGPSGSSVASIDLFSALDDQFTPYDGSFSSAANSGGSNSFGMTFTAVPEPLTLLGASSAIAFGAAFKRRKSSKG